jgi:hypothetical protein
MARQPCRSGFSARLPSWGFGELRYSLAGCCGKVTRAHEQAQLCLKCDKTIKRQGEEFGMTSHSSCEQVHPRCEASRQDVRLIRSLAARTWCTCIVSRESLL